MIKSATMLPPELMARARSSLRQRGGASDEAAKGQRMVGEAFEATLVRHMVRSMRKTVVKSELLQQNSSQGIYDHFIEDALVEQLSRGGGLGIAQLMSSGPRADRHAGAPLAASSIPRNTGKREPGGQGATMGHASVLRTGPLASNLPPQDDPWLDSPEAELQLRDLLRHGKPSTK